MHKNGKTILNAGTVITAIVMIVIIGVIYYINKLFYPKEIIPYEGYAITGKAITENLLNNNYEEQEKLSLLKIEEQEMVFKRKNTYYVGTGRHNSININYPVYINNKNALYNLSESSVLITNKFEELNSYPRYTLTDGILYNEGDLERADINTYLFIKNEDNIFINQKEIRIKTDNNNYIIPANSIIHFDDEQVAYYSLKNEELVYNKISDIDGISNITLESDKNYTYGEFLIKLNLRETVKEIAIDNKDEKKENKEEEKEKEHEKEEDKEKDNNGRESEVQKPDEQEEKYVKPEVSALNFEANVYSAKTVLDIKDVSGKITSPVTFEFRKNGKIYLRKAFLSSGNIEILGLEPSTKYTISGSYTYLNENGKQVKRDFTNQEIETKDISTLEAIELSFENGEIFSKKVQIKNLKIASPLYAEALKGIRRLELNIGNISYKIPTSKINELLGGEAIVEETQENLESNTNIKYEFKAYDLQGNELKIINNSGETRTAKEKPSVTGRVQSQDISEVEIGLKLKNKDNAKIENYRYELYDTTGNLVQDGRLREGQEILKLQNLNPNQFFIMYMYCDYDINDGNGLAKDMEIGMCNFTSVPISTLGYLHVNTQINEITKDTINLKIKIDDETTDKRLIHITKEVVLSIYEKVDGNELLVESQIIGKEKLENLKNGEELDVVFERTKI